MFTEMLASNSGSGGGISTDTFTTIQGGNTINLGYEPSMVVVDITCANNSHNLYVWLAANNLTSVIRDYKNASASGTQLMNYYTSYGINKTSNGFNFEYIISAAQEQNRSATYYAR